MQKTIARLLFAAARYVTFSMRPTFARTFVFYVAFLWCLLATALVGCGRADLGGLPDDGDGAVADDAGDAADGGPSDGLVDDSGDAIPTDAIGDTTADSGPPTVVSVSVDPATLTLPVSGTRAFTAHALLSDGTTSDVTTTATWSSDAATIVKVDSTGTGTALTAGTAHVRATISGVFGESIVTVPAATVTDVKVDPGTAETTIGGTVTFSATATLSDGTSTDVTASATWTSDAAATATVTGGVATGVAAGSTTIHAAFGGKSGSAALTVTSKVLASIEVAPFNPSLGVGVSLPLVATAIYTDGTKADVTTSATWSTSASMIVSVVASGASAGNAKGVAPGTAVVTAAFGGKSGTTTITVTAATLTALVVSPSAATIAVGGTATLTATANYSDGTTSDITASAVWTSSADGVAAVSSGTVTGVSTGTATVTASFGGKSGTATITVSAAKILSITITPADPSLPLGATEPFKATGLYEGGTSRDVTADVAWSIDDTTVATISNAAGTAGRATPVAVGKTTVRAKLGGVEGSTSLTVTAKAVTSIAVTPNPMSMVRGTKSFATATATYSDGTTLAVTASCTWSTASTATATVSNGSGSQGLVSAVGVGTTSLSCVFDGVTGTATITVTSPTVDSVSISPVAPTCHIGQTLRFTATAISTAGTGTNVTNTATWSTTPAGLLTTAAGPGAGAGAYRCTAKGSATVSATYMGVTGSTPVTITDAVVVGVQVDPVTLSLPIGGTQQYTATAVWSDGTTTNVTNMATFSSSAPAVASIVAGGGGPGGGARGRATALTAGTTTIKATYSGFSGTATLTVTNAVLTSITITPATYAAPVGIRFIYAATATYSDGTTKDVTTAASWTSSSASVAQVSDAGPTRGQATTLAAGTTTITATWGGISGKATLTVTTATLSSVEITPSTSSASVGSTVVLKAYGVYSDGSKFEVTTAAAWSSSDTTIATVATGSSTAGQVTAVKAGTATISATYSGFTGKATLNAI